jgi:succinate dehydrogenase / fumarate reductase, flavoprotein subunit
VAAERSKEDLPLVSETDLNGQTAAILAPLEQLRVGRSGITPLATKHKIGTVMRRHLHLKNEAGMLQALDAIRSIREEDLPQLTIGTRQGRYHYELMEAIEIPAMLDVAEVFIMASLMRRESRRHLIIREDYPERDDQNWLKHILIQKRNGQPDLRTIPVDFTYIRPDATGLDIERG